MKKEKINDYLKLSLLIHKRRKKFFYTIIVFICSTLLTAILFASNSFNGFISDLKKNAYVATAIELWPDTRKDVREKDEWEFEDTILNEQQVADIMNIDHVIDVTDRYGVIYGAESDDFKKNGLPGLITLEKGAFYKLPKKIVKGRNINENDEGVAVCPEKFYPDTEDILIDRKKLINGNDFIGKKVTIKYENLYYEEGSDSPEYYEKEFEIIGTYKSDAKLAVNLDTCFISLKDYYEIEEVSTFRIKNNSQKNSFHNYYVFVDDEKNVPEVLQGLTDLTYEPVPRNFDEIVYPETINKINFIISIIVFITIFTILIISILYQAKKVLKDNKFIGILKTSGYTKKQISIVYTLETIICNSSIYLTSTIVLFITLIILKLTVPFVTGVDFLFGGINIDITNIALGILFIIIIPALITYKNIRKINKNSISKLVSSEE